MRRFKITCFNRLILGMSTLLCGMSYAKDVSVLINCQPIQFSTPPTLQQNTTMVEASAVATRMGFNIVWDGNEKQILIQKSNRELILTLGSHVGWLNGQEITLPVAPFLNTAVNRAIVPLSILARAAELPLIWDQDTQTAILGREACPAATYWIDGRLTQNIVPVEYHEPLQFERSDVLIWKSNNPEVVLSEGWLMQHARRDAQRGGYFSPVQGCFYAYFFHINKSGSSKYFHLVASNPTDDPVVVQLKGSMYNNWESPLYGVGTGPSFMTSRDWLDGILKLPHRRVELPPHQARELTYLNMANMVDGRYEICTQSPILLYSVATNSGSAERAEQLTQLAPAEGIIAANGQYRYGREAGIYRSADYRASALVMLPAHDSYKAYALNTSAKLDARLQEQTSTATYHLSDSSDRTHGNYGHRFVVDITLVNDGDYARNVDVSFTSNVTKPGPSFTYNGPIFVNGEMQSIYLTPAFPYQYIGRYVVPGNSTKRVALEFVVPGLSTTNLQLVIENRTP